MRRKNKPGLNRFLVLAVVIGAGVLLLYTGCQKPKPPDLDPEQDDFYKYAHYFFTKNEREIFSSLTTKEARERFIENFWDIRDPNPYTEENEFKIEIESRYEFVSRYLREGPVPGWKTDRGRIYILLGPPSATREDIIPQGGGVIQWYYEQYNVYVLFYDDKGFGVYEMDLTTVSLGLLDVLDNNKFFIVNKEGKISWDNFDFDFNYDKNAKEVRIVVPANKINYQEIAGNAEELEAKIKVDLVIYKTDHVDEFYKVSEIKSVTVPKDKVLEKNAEVTVIIPLELPGGKIKIDAIVADYLGESVHRKLIKLEI